MKSTDPREKREQKREQQLPQYEWPSAASLDRDVKPEGEGEKSDEGEGTKSPRGGGRADNGSD